MKPAILCLNCCFLAAYIYAGATPIQRRPTLASKAMWENKQLPADVVATGPLPSPIYLFDPSAYKPNASFNGTGGILQQPDGTKAVKITSNGDEWSSCITLPQGVLKGGHDYVATLAYEIVDIPVGSYAYVFARSDSLGYGADKWVRFSGKPGDKGVVTLPMSLPKADDYTLTVGMHKKATIIVDGLTLRAGRGWNSLSPAPYDDKNGPKNYKAEVWKTLTNLPSGSTPFSIAPPAPAHTIELDATTYGLVADGTNDTHGRVNEKQAAKNSDAMAAAILAAKAAGASKLNVPAGVYRFGGNTAIHFDSMNDLTVDGNGSEFIFDTYHSWHEPAIEIDKCKRCVFQNFNVDWDWDAMPLATAGTVLGIHGDTFDMGFPALDGRGTEKLKSLKWTDISPIDPISFTATGPEYDMSDWSGTTFETLQTNVLRVHPAHQYPIAKDATYRIRFAQYDLDGFWMADDSQITMRKVNIYSIPGEGWVMTGDTNHVELDTCKIVPRPYANRPISSSADGVHINQSLGYIKLTNCEIGFCGDDCVNIHDNCSQGISLVDDYSIIAQNVDRWNTPFHTGDTIELRDSDLSPIPYSSKLTAVTFAGHTAKLTFADSLPVNLAPDTIIFNRRYGTHNVIIDNCYFHDNRGRGLLIAADNVSVTNNRFERTSNEAVYIQTEIADKWSEGFGGKNMVLVGNTFKAVNPCGSFDGSAVVVAPTIPAGVVSFPLFQDLWFDSNQFEDCDGSPIELSSCKSVTVTNNTVIYARSLPALNPMRGEVSVQQSSSVRILDNLWSNGQPNAGVAFDPASTTGVTAVGNYFATPIDPGQE